MSADKPGILQLKDSSDSEIRTQDLKKGNWSITDRKIMMRTELNDFLAMKRPGIKPIKQIELATKWRHLVPREYQNDVCPIPPQDLIARYKSDKNKKDGTVKLKEERMTVIQLKVELTKCNLPKGGVKKILVKRLQDALAKATTNTAQNNISNNKEKTNEETVDTQD